MKLAATTAENRLWRAVLEQAYEDAEQPQMADGVDPQVSVRARRYLRADPGTETEDLKLVCDFAEVPYDRVVSFARKRYSFVPPAPGTALFPPRHRARRSQRASRRRKIERRAKRDHNPAAPAAAPEQKVEQVS
jgi:hypothetical protein